MGFILSIPAWILKVILYIPFRPAASLRRSWAKRARPGRQQPMGLTWHRRKLVTVIREDTSSRPRRQWGHGRTTPLSLSLSRLLPAQANRKQKRKKEPGPTKTVFLSLGPRGPTPGGEEELKEGNPHRGPQAQATPDASPATGDPSPSPPAAPPSARPSKSSRCYLPRVDPDSRAGSSLAQSDPNLLVVRSWCPAKLGSVRPPILRSGSVGFFYPARSLFSEGDRSTGLGQPTGPGPWNRNPWGTQSRCGCCKTEQIRTCLYS
jgi:hypothetical protein